MRLKTRLKRRVTVCPPVEGSDARQRRFGEGTAVFATVLPVKDAVKEGQAGETREKRLLMLYDGATPIKAGMGVCVDEPVCDYLVTQVADFNVKGIELTYLPESRR